MYKGDQNKAILLLEDGTYFYGQPAGKIGTVTGEICYNTGMTGYQEIFTDPSYYRQIMTMTNVHIGNYGVKSNESESQQPQISGLVCRNFSEEYSREMADYSLQDFFENNGLVAISGVDTRALVKHVREKGAMNAIISSETLDLKKLRQQLSEVPDMEGLELSTEVTTKEPYSKGDPNAKYKVAALDLGIKSTILDQLVARDCFVKVFPAKSDFDTINEWEPDGFFVSNGPGDPAAVNYAIGTAKKMLETRKPFFGICLGHQLFALAMGCSTYKMHNGHRGINHPVKNLITQRCEITSQNHGFAVDYDSVENHEDLEVTHINLNDNSIEGLASKSLDAFSVQYHPEASPGPHDARHLISHFREKLEKNKLQPAS